MAEVPAGGTPPPWLHRPVPSRDWGRVAMLTTAIVLIAAGGIVIVVIANLAIGPGAFALGTAAAVLPVPFLVLFFAWLDRFEPEPTRYLLFAFGWGACVATAGALGLNTLFSFLLNEAEASQRLGVVVGAPVFEETLKAMGPLLILLFRRREFAGIVDGIVYCGLSATGFAMVENILYLGGAYVAGSEVGPATGASALVLTFILRIGLFGFAHPLFTIMIGIGLGIAARSTGGAVRWLAPLGGWFAAMFLHGLFNFLASTDSLASTGWLIILVAIGAAAVIGFAFWRRAIEGQLVSRMLPAYVRAGWLSPPEASALSTLRRRMWARRWANRVAGKEGLAAMRAYQVAATKLALHRDALLRGLPDGRNAAEERRLLDMLRASRDVFTGRDPSAPPIRWDGSGYDVPFPDGRMRRFNPPRVPVAPVPVRIADLPPHLRARLPAPRGTAR